MDMIGSIMRAKTVPTFIADNLLFALIVLVNMRTKVVPTLFVWIQKLLPVLSLKMNDGGIGSSY